MIAVSYVTDKYSNRPSHSIILSPDEIKDRRTRSGDPEVQGCGVSLRSFAIPLSFVCFDAIESRFSSHRGADCAPCATVMNAICRYDGFYCKLAVRGLLRRIGAKGAGRPLRLVDGPTARHLHLLNGDAGCKDQHCKGGWREATPLSDRGLARASVSAAPCRETAQGSTPVCGPPSRDYSAELQRSRRKLRALRVASSAVLPHVHGKSFQATQKP
jgi:hypothetical protein